MKVGDLKKRIIIKQNGTTSDNPFGTVNKEPYVTLWAKKEFLKGSELWAAKGTANKIPVKYIVRYRKDLKRNMIVVDGDESYDIKDIQPFNDLTFMIIYAEEVSTNG